MYHVIVKKKFKAAHTLKKGGAAIEPVHGHNWLCEVVISSDKLDGTGCVADFAVVDEKLGLVLAKIEGMENESSERIARQISDALAEHFNVSSVSVWEDEFHGAKYLR